MPIDSSPGGSGDATWDDSMSIDSLRADNKNITRNNPISIPIPPYVVKPEDLLLIFTNYLINFYMEIIQVNVTKGVMITLIPLMNLKINSTLL